MAISILERGAAVEADAPIESKLIDARNRLLAAEEEQLEIPEVRFRRVTLSELFDYIYSHDRRLRTVPYLNG